MSANDQRVLRAVAKALERWDGYIPHGPSDHVAIKRLQAAGLVRSIGDGVCYDCDTDAHRRAPVELPAYALTDDGRDVARKLDGRGAQ